MAQVPGDVLFLHRARVERVEVVHGRDFPAVGEQTVHEVAADESRRAGYKCMSHDHRLYFAFAACW